MIKNTHPDFEALIHDGRTAVSADLQALLELTGLAYQVSDEQIVLETALSPLNADTVLDVAGRYVDPAQLPGIHIYRHVASTNDEALRSLGRPGAGHTLMLAEMQTAGKGRRGRQWVSPFGRNIYMSYSRFLNRSLAELGGLSLIAGMQAVEVLRQLGVEGVGLKWPNDLLLEGGKLGGILVELKPAESRGIGVVIGIGINLSMAAADVSSIDQRWSHIDQQDIDRHELIGRLLAGLAASLDHFESNGFSGFQESWPHYNLTAGQQIRIIRGDQTCTGIDRGIDAEGNLLLENADGVIEAHNSGEVSMRPVEVPQAPPASASGEPVS